MIEIGILQDKVSEIVGWTKGAIDAKIKRGQLVRNIDFYIGDDGKRYFLPSRIRIYQGIDDEQSKGRD